MKNQAEFFCVARYKFTLQIWQRVKKLFYITSEVILRQFCLELILNKTIRRCLVYLSDLEQNLRYFSLPYFTHNSAVFYRIILQDKLHSFNIKDDRSTRFPSTTNYKNDNNITRFYTETSPLRKGLFSQVILLLCSMRGNAGL